MYKLRPTFDFKGYRGEVKYEKNMFYCKIAGIDSIVEVSSDDYSELKILFEKKVNQYLEECKTKNKLPENPVYSEVAVYSYQIYNNKLPEINGKIIAVSEQDVIDYLIYKYNIDPKDYINFPIISRSESFASEATEKAKTLLKKILKE